MEMLKKVLLSFVAMFLSFSASFAWSNFIPLFGEDCYQCGTTEHMLDHALSEMDRLEATADGGYIVQFIGVHTNKL